MGRARGLNKMRPNMFNYDWDRGRVARKLRLQQKRFLDTSKLIMSGSS